VPYLLLASLSLFWGLNWPGMKIILSEISVWWFRSLCLMFGGSFLMLISALSGNRCRLYRDELGPVLLCGSFAILGWMVFSAHGVSLMPAGRASIIAFTMPLWATIIAAWVLAERITASKIAGLMLGLAGLGVLIGPDLLILKRAPVGALFMLLAAVSWALGTVLLKRIAWRLPTLSNVAWQLLLSAIPVTLIAVLTEPFPDLSALSGRAIIALVYLFLFPMSFCQWAYFKTVGGVGDIVALLLVLSALVLVLLVPAWNSSRRLRAD